MGMLETMFLNSSSGCFSYEEWLHTDFNNFLKESLSPYERCCLYNEMADNEGLVMWDNIDALEEMGRFTDIYDEINHNRFNSSDDVIVREFGKFISYSYKEFADKYCVGHVIADFIDNVGLENLINKDIILQRWEEVH